MGACADCHHCKFKLRTHVRAVMNLGVGCACLQPEKNSQCVDFFLETIHPTVHCTIVCIIEQHEKETFNFDNCFSDKA